MKLIKSTAVNIGAIKEANFDFNGKSAIIVAANGRGKTTIIQALATYLQGNNKAELLNKDAPKGHMEYKLSNGERIKLELEAGKKGKATIITKDGKTKNFTQKMGKEYFPEQLDLNRFSYETPANQVKMLKKTLGIDTDKIDKEIKDLEADRAEIGREKKRITGHIQSLGEYDTAVPETETSATEIIEYIQNAKNWNNTVDSGIKRIEGYEIEAKHLAQRRENLLKEIEQIEIEIAEKEVGISQEREWLEANKAIDLEVIEQQEGRLATIEVENRAVRQNAEIRKQTEELATITEDYDKKTRAIEEKRAERIKLFSSAQLPDSIKIEDDGIYIDGLPLVPNQHARSEIGINELKIAALTLGKAKWLTFDAASLDRANLEKIKTWAKESNLQLLIEQPNRGSEQDDELHFELVE